MTLEYFVWDPIYEHSHKMAEDIHRSTPDICYMLHICARLMTFCFIFNVKSSNIAEKEHKADMHF